MGDDPHVGFDDLHVDAVLLLSDDDRPPQPDVLPLLLGAVRGDRVMRVACATPAGRAGLWSQTEQHTAVITGAPVWTQYSGQERRRVTASQRPFGRLDSILTFFTPHFCF